ncbi:MAG: hypothetical protein ACSLFM_02395, partial [Tepidiformaceae bacterium]
MTLAEYEYERHGDGAWRVVKAVFEEYGWPFEVDGYDADVARPDLWYPQRGGGFVVVEAEGSAGAPEVVGCVGYT